MADYYLTTIPGWIGALLGAVLAVAIDAMLFSESFWMFDRPDDVGGGGSGGA